MSMGMMIGYLVGMVMLCVIIIACGVMAVYYRITMNRPDPFMEELYAERLEIIRMLEKDQRLDK